MPGVATFTPSTVEGARSFMCKSTFKNSEYSSKKNQANETSLGVGKKEK